MILITDAVDAAGVEAKGSVVIQVGPGDAAKDGENRKIVADHDNLFSGSMAPDDSIQSIPRPLIHINQPLASRDDEFRRFLPPFGDEIGILVPDFGKS